jgi:hypothetical protein
MPVSENRLSARFSPKAQPKSPTRKNDACQGFYPSLLEETLGALAIAGCAILSPFLRPWYRKWGATASELSATLPGDDMVPRPNLECTRALTIHAPSETTWPWLAQMGHGRGGLYTYQRLENLAGCQMVNADRILSEYQDLRVGDKVKLGPDGYPSFDVKAVDPGRSLVLCGAGGAEQTAPITSMWVFFLQAVDRKPTRPIVRSRTAYQPSFANLLIWRMLTDPISFVVERKMLQGVKERAEASTSA